MDPNLHVILDELPSNSSEQTWWNNSANQECANAFLVERRENFKGKSTYGNTSGGTLDLRQTTREPRILLPSRAWKAQRTAFPELEIVSECFRGAFFHSSFPLSPVLVFKFLQELTKLKSRCSDAIHFMPLKSSQTASKVL